MTVDEYVTFERAAKEKHEFREGVVIRVAGGSPEHNMICMDTAGALSNALKAAGGKCDVLGSDQKVHVSDSLYLYPDLTVVCGAAQFDDRDALRNPVALIEVLSPSTEREDRTD